MLLSLELLLLSNSEMPFRSILRAARISRSLMAPHAGHTHVRSRNDSPLLMQPHSQVLEEGYHLSILCIVTPYYQLRYIFQIVYSIYVVELTHDSIQNNIHEASFPDTLFSLNDRCCICMKSFFLITFTA